MALKTTWLGMPTRRSLRDTQATPRQAACLTEPQHQWPTCAGVSADRRTRRMPWHRSYSCWRAGELESANRRERAGWMKQSAACMTP